MYLNLSFSNGFTVSIKFVSFTVIAECITLSKKVGEKPQQIPFKDLVYYSVTEFPFWSNVVES